jgi:hypothetical protein
VHQGAQLLAQRLIVTACRRCFLFGCSQPSNNSSHHYYRTPTVYHPTPETASEIMQEPCTKPDSKNPAAKSDDAGKSCKEPRTPDAVGVRGRCCLLGADSFVLHFHSELLEFGS